MAAPTKEQCKMLKQMGLKSGAKISIGDLMRKPKEKK